MDSENCVIYYPPFMKKHTPRCLGPGSQEMRASMLHLSEEAGKGRTGDTVPERVLGLAALDTEAEPTNFCSYVSHVK